MIRPPTTKADDRRSDLTAVGLRSSTSGRLRTALRLQGPAGPIPRMTLITHTNSQTPGDRLARLSSRQAECLDLAAVGLTSAAIAARLGLSSRTVDEHLTGACRVLGVRTRIQAVALLALGERRAREKRSFLP